MNDAREGNFMRYRRLLLTTAVCATWLAGLSTGVAAAAQAAVAAMATDTGDASSLLLNGRQPSPDLLTGGQPTLEQFQALDELGYTTVINLRSEAEMTDAVAGRDEVEALGMKYVFIPVASPADLSRDNVQLFADALSAADGPTVVHCASGNRVGAMFALKAYYLDGVPPEKALEIGLASGLTSLEPVVRQQLGLE